MEHSFGTWRQNKGRIERGFVVVVAAAAAAVFQCKLIYDLWFIP
jgi:hypothetical protein